MKEADWKTLVFAIRRRTCILFLGPDIPVPTRVGERSSQSTVPTMLSRRLAGALRDSCQGEASEVVELGNPESLPHVAQLASHKLGPIALQEHVDAFLQGLDGKSTPFHKKLASIPFHLCITTCPDSFLTTALEQAGRKPRDGFFDFNGDAGQAVEIGKDPDHPTVYHLYGRGSKLDSLVLTEDDQLDYLINIVKKNPPLPGNLVSELNRKNTVFLFVGFGLYRWHLRVLLRVLGATQSRNTSFAFEQLPGPLSDAKRIGSMKQRYSTSWGTEFSLTSCHLRSLSRN